MQQQTEIFVPKSLAMELRKKGFNEHCVAQYLSWHDDKSTIPYIKAEHRLFNAMIENGIDSCTASTYDQVVGWFASKGIDIDNDCNSSVDEYCTYVYGNDGCTLFEGEWMSNRQQSLLTAFEEALKLI